MQYKTVTSTGGHLKYKVLPNDTAYTADTPDYLIEILERLRLNHTRCRFYFGDINTGRDWEEQFDVFGYISRSTGRIKIPLLINSARSLGGGALMTGCIVKIEHADKRKGVIWQHPKYHHSADGREIARRRNPKIKTAIKKVISRLKPGNKLPEMPKLGYVPFPDHTPFRGNPKKKEWRMIAGRGSPGSQNWGYDNRIALEVYQDWKGELDRHIGEIVALTGGGGWGVYGYGRLEKSEIIPFHNTGDPGLKVYIKGLYDPSRTWREPEDFDPWVNSWQVWVGGRAPKFKYKPLKNPRPPARLKLAKEMRTRYHDDLKAGHHDASEYWRGQAAALFTDNPLTRGGWSAEWKYGVTGTNLAPTPQQKRTWFLWGYSPKGTQSILARVYRSAGRKFRFMVHDDTAGGKLLGEHPTLLQAKKMAEDRFGIIRP